VAQTFDRVVIQVEVRHFDFFGQRLGLNGVAVVLRRDVHLARHKSLPDDWRRDGQTSAYRFRRPVRVPAADDPDKCRTSAVGFLA
jgi:hypothetical protein